MIVESIDEVTESDIEEEESNDVVLKKRKGKLCCWLYVVIPTGRSKNNIP